MAVYADVANFMIQVRAANPNYERWGRSSLRPLLAVLNNANGTAQQVCQAIAALPADKTLRYLDPLYYLLSNYPGLPANAVTNLNLNLTLLSKTAAHRYPQVSMPGNFKPDGPQSGHVFATTKTTPLNRTLEQYIIENHAVVGVLLIHLSDWVKGMELMFDGRATLTHINSVIRVARLMGCELCCLTMNANADVCAELVSEYNQIGHRVKVLEPTTHTSSDLKFTTFIARQENLVVMGFDAAICVFANVFGSNDRDQGAFRPPLLTQTNIVMSRAALVSDGNISSAASHSMGQAEYGPLWDQ
jgi:hypothetical protein